MTAISIIIPSYNAAHYISEALTSIQMQCLADFEVVVIDDGSTDDTKAALNRHVTPVRYLRQEHRGIGAARNLGIREARGEIIAFVDADDIWTETKMALQLDFLERNPTIAIVGGGIANFYSSELSAIEQSQVRTSSVIASGFIPSSTVVRKSAFETAGNFREDLKLGEFVEWCSRARGAGLQFSIIPEVVVHRRIHRTNTGITMNNSRSDYVRIAFESLKRRREAEARQKKSDLPQLNPNT